MWAQLDGQSKEDWMRLNTDLLHDKNLSGIDYFLFSRRELRPIVPGQRHDDRSSSRKPSGGQGTKLRSMTMGGLNRKTVVLSQGYVRPLEGLTASWRVCSQWATWPRPAHAAPCVVESFLLPSHHSCNAHGRRPSQSHGVSRGCEADDSEGRHCPRCGLLGPLMEGFFAVSALPAAKRPAGGAPAYLGALSIVETSFPVDQIRHRAACCPWIGLLPVLLLLLLRRLYDSTMMTLRQPRHQGRASK